MIYKGVIYEFDINNNTVSKYSAELPPDIEPFSAILVM